MTFKDFFWLDNEDFKLRISKLSNERLMRQDIHNCRTISSGLYGAIIAAGLIPFTNGISLIDVAISLRRSYIGKKRLRMIYHELAARDLPIHQQTKRDHLIPLTIAGICLPIGLWMTYNATLEVLSISLVSAANEGGIGIASTAILDVLSPTILSSANEALVQSLESVVDFIGGLMSDHVIGVFMPGTGTGRRHIWAEKLRRSKKIVAAAPSRAMDKLPIATINGVLPITSPATETPQQNHSEWEVEPSKGFDFFLRMLKTWEERL